MKLLVILPAFSVSVCMSIHGKQEMVCKSRAAAQTADSSLNLHSWHQIRKLGDEFNAKKFDSSKWRKGLWYDVSGDFAFKNENVFISGGSLHLSAKKEKFNGKEFTIGAVESTFDFPAEPSLIRVRAKLLADSVNVCSAIWLQTWPEVIRNPNPEIDIIEYFAKNEMHMNLFTWIKDSAGKYEHVDFNGNIYDYKRDMSAQFHIYALERTKGQLRFYFDDKLVCTWNCPDTGFSRMPRHLILSLEGHRDQPNVSLLPASFDIDWVRVYGR